ncbi:MAG TPA: hypothetical protein VF288_10865, partial [Mycobacteriales bacterium]
MPAGAGYLPPVVVTIVADDADFIAKLAADKAALGDFAKTVTKTQLGATSEQFQDDLVAAKVELASFAKQVTDTQLGADAAPFWTSIAELRATLAAMSPLGIDVTADTAAALAKIEALRGALALSQVDQMAPVAEAGGKRGGGSFLGTLLGGAAGGKGGGGSGLGLAALLGFGGRGGGGHRTMLGAATGGLLGMGATFGSAGSLMGFGAEHFLTTGLGVLGSAGMASLGGAALGATSLGVMGVGMGTDMAGLGQAAGDIKNVTTAQENLTAAVADYGPKSQEAAVAQAQLNTALTSFNPVARDAVVQASGMVAQFKTMFDQYTGLAEKTGAQIISQAIGVGEKFLPTVGKYAAQNMKIIQSGLQPLFSWLKGPGVAAFTTLENAFQKTLPVAVHAGSQALELVMRVMAKLAPQTGKLTAYLNKLFTEANHADFGKLMSFLDKAIADFRTWEGFIKALGHDLVEMFKPSLGAGRTFMTILTGLLVQVGKWLKVVGGKGGVLSGLFGAHLGELKGIGGIIKNLLPAVEQFATDFMQVERVVVGSMMVPVLNAIAKAL